MGACASKLRRICAIAAALTVALVFAALSTAGASAAEAPRWVLEALPTPTHVAAETPRDQVDEVKVDASAGTFALELQPVNAEPGKTAALPFDASAVEVQEAIELLPGLAGNVSVSGGSGAYEVVFEGSQGDVPQRPMRLDASQLQGGSGSVSVLERGANPPQLIITATNVGGAASSGAIEITDALPAWLTATKVVGFDAYAAGFSSSAYGGIYGGQMSCAAAPAISCSYTGKVDTGDQLVLFVTMNAGAAPAGSALNLATVKGGGAAEVTSSTALREDSTPAPPGPAEGGVFAAISNAQAGAHPDIVTSFQLNTEEADVISGGYAKDVSFDLPPGLVGSTVGMPRCSMTRVIAAGRGGDAVCPADTMVGVAEIIGGPTKGTAESGTFVAPIYNITPSPGEPAAFAFDVIILPVRLDTSVLSNGKYGVRVTAHDLSQSAQVFASTITIWGVPSEHSGAGRNKELYLFPPETFGGPEQGQSPIPLMTSPQQCSEPMAASMLMDTWADPGDIHSVEAPMGTLTGCSEVPFSTSFSFLPDTLEAGAPAGYDFNLDVPQQNTAGTLATSSVREVHLKLPEGVVVNPSAAWGLKACTSAQFYGPDHPSEEPASLAECPREAKIGEVEVETPDLEHPLRGDVFLGSPECDPCTPQDAADGKMVRLMLQLVGEGEAGIIVKLEGHGLIDQSTGQITTVFQETPQLPFNHMRFVLEGGPRAVLANPRSCGPVRSSGDLMPWSALLGAGETEATPDSTPSYEFEISQSCFGPKFQPTLKAGMPNIQAGAHGQFTLAFGREDGDQFFKQITLQMPKGLLGTLTGVELCGQAQANAGSCGAGSLIGEAQVLTGPGANPFLVEGGKVYLTEGYGGSQFGLSIVVPAVAGPYTLGGVDGEGKEADDGKVVVRTQLFIDRHTAQITAVSGDLPSVLDGIPLQLKAVNVRLNRSGFMFNPTSCERMAIAGAIASEEGVSANVSSPFQVTNCASLPFKPVFRASTKAKHTRKDGAYLHVSVESSSGQADIGYAKVELPKALPSELRTLQHACTEAQFNANPAGCPAESDVGTAEVQTPVVPVPLAGPAYFVSRGAQWPELIMVLQGYGVTVDLAGETHISKGITSTTLASVPDVPFTRFSLTLPEKEYSALAGNGNLCAQHLAMPIRLIGQNGAVVERKSAVEVEGCPSAFAISSHRVRGRRLTVKVYAPEAGRVSVRSRGLTRSRKTAKGRETLTFRLREKHAGRLRTTLVASFTPKAGSERKREVKRVRLVFKRR